MGLMEPVDTTHHYEAPLIAKLLHKLPHYNITFHRIANTTFRPTDAVYLESLGILGSVPAALLIVSLFGLLLYLMTRCCDRKPRPAHSIKSLKITLSIVTVLCCAAIGLGLYGNDDLHNGLLEVLTAGRKVDNLVSSVRNQWYPFVGNSVQLRKTARKLGGTPQVYEMWSKEFNSPDVVGFSLGNKLFIVGLSYKAVFDIHNKQAFEGRPRNLFTKLRTFDTHAGIMIADGDLWREHRSFAMKRLKSLGFGCAAMQEMIENELVKFKEVVDREMAVEGCLWPGKFLATFVMNVLWKLVAGNEEIDGHSIMSKELFRLLDERSKAFDFSGGLLSDFPWLRFILPEYSGFNLMCRFNVEIKSILQKIIDHHKRTYTPEKANDDFVYTFIHEMKKQEGNPKSTFTEIQLMITMVDFFFGGSHTTNITFDLALMTLALNEDIQEKLHTEIERTHILENTLAMKIRPQLVELADIFDQPASNQTALSQLIMALNVVQGNVTIAINAAGDIRRPLMGIVMSGFLNMGDQWELIRWPGTVAILALLLVLCAVLLVGVARHSRCALILFSVCGLLAVTGSWLMSGLYLSSSVAVGDLCIDPAEYLASEAPSEMPTDVLLYYTQCESVRSNPFTQRLRESQNAINNARTSMSTVSKVSLVLFKSAGLQPKLGAVTADLNLSERLLTQLTALVDCKAIHYNYLTAARGLCEGGLLGLVLMLIASFIAAILLTVMVWVDSHTWIYIRKRNDYSQVDEPSYISHQPQQNHQNMTRTLPRNHNGPPAISGSHTLAHAGRKHHEMMAHPHVHPHHGTMRPMGTHTLGRLPSHNHSPGHMPAACGDPHGNSSHAHHHQHHYSDGHQVQIQAHHQMQHQPLAVGSMATMRRPVAREDAIPSSNVVDSAMFERDKQIYKCSTMRQGGRFDQRAMKPAILNCPLPEIPRKGDEQVLSAEELKVSTARNHPQRTLKLPPNAKAIPPPKILSPLPSELAGGAAKVPALPAASNGEKIGAAKSPIVAHPPATTPTSINPNDESNYAVTEL
uniref:Protein tweety homolog n=2 Tax=Lutzomyia longipalpis TaxID=7200 RepID=A0A1B0C9Q4_LUTLO